MLKKIIKKIFRNKPLSMQEKINNYRKAGITIGENCYIYSTLPTGRDCFLLNIGNNVTISGNVSFLLHDASIGTITNFKYTDLLGNILISDNCFIGFGSIILPGVTLAEGTIVGAGSVVTKSVGRKNTIIAGNPARFICSVEDYINKNSQFFVNLDGMSKDDVSNFVEADPGKIIKRDLVK